MAHLPFFCQLHGRSTSDASSLSCADGGLFEDPDCIACRDRVDRPDALMGATDPFKSRVANGWLRGQLQAPN
jgi:hypothetical protein